ncbi:MAG: GGDEF domain-containing protein [Gammaproteobacteria bacterium]|nr:GGDEF domain-containing protein [Gammaproteobacteria bacterium]MBU1489194.1 GGDEF domain-containing protein [Gammaproteobacteria bacterium]MBU2066014.1 GGDEF domain-containing protein [Gammaproteobacteria bacterium]MBU2138446.1 GGDEF domain-containing protein [Gammaproteobacteria bacterium]MBU2323116.1 GGDEF domain-containing protein [Gammaproteobacteria bacterium]
MIAHTPTLFASVALVATIMAFCLILVGQLNRRDGLFATGCGLALHALAYTCYTLHGQAPLWLTYGAANVLLATALTFYLVGLLRIQGMTIPWRRLLSLPALMLILMISLINTREPRMLAACLVLIVQCLLLISCAYRHAAPGGRAHILLVIGGGISLVGLLMRVGAILTGGAAELQYDASNFKQTLSVSIGTVTVMMFSLGLVLIAKERSEASLQQMALRDALTGTLNRRAILEQLSAELERARRAHTYLAVAMLDIDHFKRINDVYGHLAGDEVLCHCVQHLRQRLRQADSVGRYGGEEFLLLLTDTTPQGAYAALEALRSSMAAAPAHFGNLSIDVQFSAGIWCGIPGPYDSVASLLTQADTALYAAKATGRNNVQVALADTPTAQLDP